MDTFERDYKLYHYEIYVFLFGMTRSEQEAQELLQDTFMAFLQQLRAESMSAQKKRRWLYKVAKNKAINCIRRSALFSGVEAPEIPDETTPEQKVTEKERLLQIQGVMKRLNQREAMILQLYSAGLNYQEMAEIMELEISSISKTLGRAKKAFKRLYRASR